jgi:hypothetical protein
MLMKEKHLHNPENDQRDSDKPSVLDGGGDTSPIGVCLGGIID